MTTEELLAIPEDGMKRELSAGRLRERGVSMGGRQHSRTLATLAAVAERWLSTQSLPRGEVLCGGATFRLQRDPDTTFETDLAYISAALARTSADDVEIFDGVPVLAVEIMSPNDRHCDLFEKIEDFLGAGVPLVWLVEPAVQTVTVFQPHLEPRLFRVGEDLVGEPHLPGFRAPVVQIFGD